MKKTLKLLSLLSASAMFAVGSSAQAVTTDSSPAANDHRSSNIISGTGWTDVSKLKIVPLNEFNSVPLTSQEIRDMATSPMNHSSIKAIKPYTNEVDCGDRIDWYRVISDYGYTVCFANDGDLFYPTTDTKYLCPGNNSGQVVWRYKEGGRSYWSRARSGYDDHNTCYSFSTEVYSGRVRLWR